jgi:cell division protein FtsB
MDERIVVRRPVGPPPFALRVAAVLVVPLLLYALVATGQKAVDNYRLNQEADRLRADIVGLRAENIQLQQSLEDARTDVAIETIAREQLGLIRQGDHPVVIVGQPAAAPNRLESQESAQSQAAADSPVWRQWWDYFFGYPAAQG